MFMVAAAATAQAVGSLIKGASEQSVLDYQSDIQRQNARQSLEAAKFDANRQSMIAEAKIGSITADAGASGIDTHSGTVLDVLASSASNAELDRLNILHGGTIRSINYENQASLDTIAGKNARTGSYFGAGASLLGGASRLYSYNYGGGGQKQLSDDEGS